MHMSLSIFCQLTILINVQQVPEEIDRVMVGLEAYLSIRRRATDTGLSFFEEDDDESGKGVVEKVWSLYH